MVGRKNVDENGNKKGRIEKVFFHSTLLFIMKFLL
jgi:hypothetical protein